MAEAAETGSGRTKNMVLRFDAGLAGQLAAVNLGRHQRLLDLLREGQP
jgi:hypothetical protein